MTHVLPVGRFSELKNACGDREARITLIDGEKLIECELGMRITAIENLELDE